MLIPLIQNETLKIVRRKRFAVVIAILFVILALVTYSQVRRLRDQQNRNWRAEIQQRVANFQNMMRRGRVKEGYARGLRGGNGPLPVYLDHCIEPDKTTAAPFVLRFPYASG